MILLPDPLALEPLTESDRELARSAIEKIRAFPGTPTGVLTLLGDREERLHIPLPSGAPTLLSALLTALLNAKPVTLLPRETLLTLPQAAQLLNMMPEAVRQVLETGALPFSEGTTGVRIRYADLRDYLERRQEARHQVLRELIEETERLGLYETRK